MYYFKDSAEKHLKNRKYRKLTRKPWNVKPGDVIILHHLPSQFKPEHFIPVEITITDKYPEYYRNTNEWHPTSLISQTTYRYDHKPLNEDDKKYLYDWWSTKWHSFDEVEIWRKPHPKNLRS